MLNQLQGQAHQQSQAPEQHQCKACKITSSKGNTGTTCCQHLNESHQTKYTPITHATLRCVAWHMHGPSSTTAVHHCVTSLCPSLSRQPYFSCTLRQTVCCMGHYANPCSTSTSPSGTQVSMEHPQHLGASGTPTRQTQHNTDQSTVIPAANSSPVSTHGAPTPPAAQIAKCGSAQDKCSDMHLCGAKG